MNSGTSCTFCERQSEGVSFLRVRPGFESCFNLEARFSTILNSTKIFTKITNMISEMDRVPTRRLWRIMQRPISEIMRGELVNPPPALHLDMCKDMCTDMCIYMCADMSLHICHDCRDRRNLWLSACVWTRRHMSGHVYRHAERHVNRHVY